MNNKICDCKIRHCEHYQSDFDRYVKEHPIEDGWEKSFRNRFVRDDGLMNKYAYDEDGDPSLTADEIMLFIKQVLSQRDREVVKQVMREIGRWHESEEDYQALTMRMFSFLEDK